MISLYIKNIIFFILQPGLVVGLIPYLLIRNKLSPILSDRFSLLDNFGLVLIFLGLLIAIYCVYRFIIDGLGTLSPLHRTKALVVK